MHRETPPPRDEPSLFESPANSRAVITMSDYGFPTFRCTRPVSPEDVKELDEEL